MSEETHSPLPSAQNEFGRRRSAVQIYARDLRIEATGPLVLLRQGHAHDLRPPCRAGHLVCPLPDCARPGLTTRARNGYRDHFVHLDKLGGSHSPESIAHHTAKHALAAWLRGRYPKATVTVDDARIETNRKPDVLAVATDKSGMVRRAAFEIQYSHISVEEWQGRTCDYAAADVQVTWLFGHFGTNWRDAARGSADDWLHCRLKSCDCVDCSYVARSQRRRSTEYLDALRSPADLPAVLAPEICSHMVSQGISPVWFDPYSEIVATGIVPRGQVLESEHGDRGRYRIPVAFAPLASCFVKGTLRTPHTEHFAQLCRQRVDATHRASKPLAARLRAEAEEVRMRDAIRIRDLRRRFADAGVTIPSDILKPSARDGAIARDPQLWKLEIWAQLIHGQVGSRFDPKVAFRIASGGKRQRYPDFFEAVSAFLRRLRAIGLVTYQDEDGYVVDSVEVVRDFPPGKKR